VRALGYGGDPMERFSEQPMLTAGIRRAPRMSLRPLIGLAALGLIACAGASASSWPTANAACQGAGLEMARAYGLDAQLLAGFEVPAARMAAWDERAPSDGGPQIVNSKWRQRPVNERVAVCYYGGNFDKFGLRPAPVDATTAVQLRFERLVVTVSADGTAGFRSIGPARSLPVEDPAK